jgi:hypothetical protein
MNKKTMVDYFGDTKATAKALGVTTQAVYSWPDIVPKLRAMQAHLVSGGKLKLKPGDYK